MAMDGLTLASSIREMEGQLLGARIEKIYQPERDELILALRGSHRLLLSSHAANCRAQLTKVSRQNPSEPPMFCMRCGAALPEGAKFCTACGQPAGAPPARAAAPAASPAFSRYLALVEGRAGAPGPGGRR